MTDQTYAYYPIFRATAELRRTEQTDALRLVHDAEILFKEWDERVHVRGHYSTVGFRPDADLMMWWVAGSADDVQQLVAAFRRTVLGRHLDQTWAFMGVHRPPEVAKDHQPAFMRGEGPKRYLNVYPFVRTKDWYLIPQADRAALLREHGEMGKYESVRVGYTARLDALQALVLSRKLPLLEGWNAERRNAADFYAEALEGKGDLRLPKPVDGATHVWHVYAIRTSDPISLAAFLAERGIATSRHYPQAPHLSRAFEHLGLSAGSFPVAEAVARETLSLPIFPGISGEQLEAVVGAVSEYFARG